MLFKDFKVGVKFRRPNGLYICRSLDKKYHRVYVERLQDCCGGPVLDAGVERLLKPLWVWSFPMSFDKDEMEYLAHAYQSKAIARHVIRERKKIGML